MRAKLLAVMATVMALVGVGVLPSTAAAEKSDCPAGYLCVWEGPTFGGNRAFFAGSETGTHTLAGIDPRSAYNHTGNHEGLFWDWYAGPPELYMYLGPGEAVKERPTPYTDDLIIS